MSRPCSNWDHKRGLEEGILSLISKPSHSTFILLCSYILFVGFDKGHIHVLHTGWIGMQRDGDEMVFDDPAAVFWQSTKELNDDQLLSASASTKKEKRKTWQSCKQFGACLILADCHQHLLHNCLDHHAMMICKPTWRAAGESAITSAASLKDLLALCSPSAAITCTASFWPFCDIIVVRCLWREWSSVEAFLRPFV